MMTSKTSYNEAFVWIWLPEETEPVVAGRLEADNGNLLFNYGKSYLQRVHDSKRAISIYEGELPLKAGILPLLDGLNMPGCIRDGAPDAWGRRVIINKKLGAKGTGIDTAQLDELTYLLESGSDRIGAHNFLLSKDEALAIFETQKDIIEKNWMTVCDEAALNETDRKLLWGRQFLNSFAFEGMETNS